MWRCIGRDSQATEARTGKCPYSPVTVLSLGQIPPDSMINQREIWLPDICKPAIMWRTCKHNFCYRNGSVGDMGFNQHANVWHWSYRFTVVCRPKEMSFLWTCEPRGMPRWDSGGWCLWMCATLENRLTTDEKRLQHCDCDNALEYNPFDVTMPKQSTNFHHQNNHYYLRVSGILCGDQSASIGW